MNPQNTDLISEDEIITFLKATAFFAQTDIKCLRELIPKFENIFVVSGDILIQQGEEGDSLFLVVTGRLQAIRYKAHGQVILSEMRRGDIVGELALLTDQPRAATVIATRDSVVLKLSKKSFQDYIQNNSHLIMPIVNTAIKRVLSRKTDKTSGISTVALVPASTNQIFSEFGKTFAKELEKVGTTLHLTRNKVETFLKEVNIHLDKDINPALTYWLNEQEAKYQFIIYEADLDYSIWTRQCIRHADRILLIADTDENPNLNSIEQQIFSQTQTTKKPIDMVLLHKKPNFSIKRTANWLANRTIKEYHHIHYALTPDFQRLIRSLTGRRIGLVLGGGGARSLAHIGVYKALNELNIPIDIIGGTSFGALLGGFFASETPIDVVI